MKLYLASGNAHKVAEFQALADLTPDLGLEIHSAREVGGMPAVVEDTGSFTGNARKKALGLRAIVQRQGWTLADDSGLCVEHLDGAPGVESAYFAGPQADPAANLDFLVGLMRDVPAGSRRAYFVCVLVMIGPDFEELVFEGRCDGTLLVAPEGGGGFGYDPLFVPDGYRRSFADLGDVEKNRVSHRAQAWAGLVAWARTRTRADRP